MFPQQIDNTYRGQTAALWLFGFVLLIRLAMSFNCIFNGYAVATGADGVPLAKFSPAAVQMIVFDFAAWGLAHLVLSLICMLALVRYRSAVPMMFAALLTEFAARKVIRVYIPIETGAASPAFYVNWILFTSLTIGLLLSLWPRRSAQAVLA